MKQIKRLLDQFIPDSYQLNLDISTRVARTFRGTVTITGHLLAASATISLHAKELTIESATINGQPVEHRQLPGDELQLTASTPLPAAEHQLELAFSGRITDPMNGLYPCYFKLDGKDEELLATQFESHHAREVFPCVDEPAAKATFDLQLTTEKNITVIANTPIKNQHATEDVLVTSFETTPRMSSYLLAWVAGTLAYKEATTKAGVVVRTYATPDKVEKTTFALETAVKTLDFYNEYFAIGYPLAKCDLIGLPDFSSGAMENWGCITFRESCYFVDKHTAIGVKQYVAMVVAHELAHQWFGNLVTMQWWDDLWLNESFATWIEFLAIDHLFPDWQIWTQFYDNETVHALDRDSLATVQRVRQTVSDPDEIRTLFDAAIVYAKGASLLHMLHAYTGPAAFRDGLRLYLAEHRYNNAEADDLWQALGQVSGKDISSFMQPWISQSGHPVVTVELQGNQATVRQERFFSNAKEAKDQTTLWPVPLLSEQLEQEILSTRQAVLTVKPTDEPLLINKGRTGFYVTQYPADHLAQLATAIAANNIGIVDRMALLSEAYDLAKAGQQSTSAMLTLLAAYKHEASQPVWGAIGSAIGALKMLINDDPAHKPMLQSFVARLSHEQYQRLTWDQIAGESYFDELLRPSIIGLQCYAEQPEAIERALTLFAQAESPESIWGNIRGTVLAVTARNGQQADFERMLAWYRDQASAELRIQLAAGLSSTRNLENIQQLLDMLTTKEVKLQDIFYWFIYLIRNPHGRQATWQWMIQNWAWIEAKFGSDMHYDDFPTYAGNAFSTAAEHAQFTEFFAPKQHIPALRRAILQGQEDIESRRLWRERDLESVQAFLRDQATTA